MKNLLLFAIMVTLAFSVFAQAQDFSITIDAEKDAWYDGLTGPADGQVFLPSGCYLPEIGSARPDDDADLSAVIWSAWDDTYLYFYAEVKDDIVTASNTARYENDCIELKFDPNPGVGEGTGTANLRLTALGADLAEEQTGVDNLNGSGNMKDGADTKWVPTEADYARKLIDGGYALEFRAPRDYINVIAESREMVWGEGEVFGMAINVGDNDAASRDNMLQWSAGHTDQAHSDAVHHGSVTFLADHKLKLEAVSPRDPSVVNDSADVWYSNPNSAVDVEPVSVKSFNLVSNYPNPFNPETRIQYQIQRAEQVTLAIYSVTGELIRHLTADQFQAPGSYETIWNGKNDLGQIVGSGIYFCKLTTPSMTASNKMMMLK